MYIVYHKDYAQIYSHEPAAAPGRMEAIYNEIKDDYRFVTPKNSSRDDVLLVHTPRHVAWVERIGVYYISTLSVGGAIKASQYASNGIPSFALIRPPGHHASPNSCWGFCYLNNIAIAVESVRKMKGIDKVLIVDFDLHYGDGTYNSFKDSTEVTYFHVLNVEREEQIKSLSNYLDGWSHIDLLAVSAGFDRHIDDWGGTLETKDYKEIGSILRDFSVERCIGRRFAVLEGGYNHMVLGKNVEAFLQGFG